MANHAHDLTAPDLILPGVSGGSFNPADFRGQRLALFLCPDDPDEAAREIEAWRGLVDHFQDAGVWLLGIAHDRVPEECLSDKAGRHIAIARDSDSRLRSLLMPHFASGQDGATPDPGLSRPRLALLGPCGRRFAGGDRTSMTFPPPPAA